MPSLVTVADVETYLDSPVPAGNLALVDRLIAEASDAYLAATGAHMGLVSGQVEDLNVTVGGLLVLRGFPVTAVTKVETRTGADWTEVDSTLYEWSHEGLVEGTWPVGLRRVRVTYDYGYAAPPADVVAAVARAVAERYRAHTSGAASLATGVTVAQVLALVPEASLDVPEADLHSLPLTTDDVHTWIEQTAADVSLRCYGWGALPLGDFPAAAARLVAHGAAATLERSRFPERSAGPVDSSHASALQQIYDEGVAGYVSLINDLAPRARDWSFVGIDRWTRRTEGPLPW